MKLREQSNISICNANNLPFAVMTNVVEEINTKNRMRATSQLIAKALIATLGPYGSSTIIQDRQGHHFATKDGYDLLNRMNFSDEVSSTILDLFRMTASNQVFSVGDGSTSAIVVANALFQALTDPDKVEHFKRIAPKDITDILNDLAGMVEAELKKMAKKVSPDMHEIDVLAAVANNNDVVAGRLIGDIYRKIGPYGFITMDVLDKQEKDTYEIKSGIEWGRGYIDPIFATGCNDSRIIYDQTPKVILSRSALTYDDLELVLMPLMKHAFNQEGVQLVVVANDFDDDVLNFLKANRTKHMKIGSKDTPMEFTAVDIDQVTKESRNKLDDLALICGCEIYDKYTTQKAQIIAHPEKFVGRAQKAVITPKETQIIGCDTNDMTPEHRKAIELKRAEFEKELAKLSNIEVPTKEEDERIYELRQRSSRLGSSTAILHVGGKTLTERMTRQRLIEDSVFAAKSALQYGYIPGGNICVPKILSDKKEAFSSVLGSKYSYLPIDNIRSFFAYFIDILINAFLESYRAVLNNSYMSEEDTEATIKKCLEENKFYNLKLHEFENMDETLVINSTQTDVQILRSCISIIGILSMSNQFITLNLSLMDQIDKDKK